MAQGVTKSAEVMFLQGEKNCLLVSSSDPIPDGDTEQPPHMQAAEYYRDVAKERGDKDNFLVTMETPSVDRPRPIVIDVTRLGLSLNRSAPAATPGASVVSRKPPKLGKA